MSLDQSFDCQADGCAYVSTFGAQMASGKTVPEWARGKYCPYHIEQAGVQAYGVQTQMLSPDQTFHTPLQGPSSYGYYDQQGRGDQQYDRR